MFAVTFSITLLVALLVTPFVWRSLVAGDHLKVNYRGHNVAFPLGIAIVLSAVVALIPLGLFAEVLHLDVFAFDLQRVAMYVFGIAGLGLVDDLLAGEPRGWREHIAALRHGELSTGMIKAFGGLGLAMLALSGQGIGSLRYLLAVAILVLATNLFNLLDLRPGRSWKVFMTLGLVLFLSQLNFDLIKLLAIFIAPIIVVGYFDLREQAMLGDTGSNIIGAVAGFWLVFAFGLIGQLITLGILTIITVYGEFHSISILIERTPGLKQLDAAGRPD